MRKFVRSERGFALLDMVVATAILGALVLAGVATYGSRPVTAHSGAIALEQAMAEARSLAAANSDTTDLLHPSGATVIVEPDPSGLHGSSRIAVYRSRPVVFNGQTPYPPIRDVGFPPQRVSATFTFTGSSPDGASTVSEPFAIMLSGSGYASIQHFTGSYDETAPTYWSSDPGCPADGARIAVADGVSSEGHAFGCVGGFYAAN